jgi:CRP-like cAMP-binding protein
LVSPMLRTGEVRTFRKSNPSENWLLASLSRETLALLEPALEEISESQGAVLLQPAEAIRRVYFPQSGMISLVVVTGDGNMIEASAIGQEGAVGLHRGLGDRRSFTRAVVQIPGRFSVIAAHRFEEITRESLAIRKMIARYTELLWAEAQQIAACNAIHDVSSRLCRWLLQSADRVNSTRLPLTQELLGQMLGVRRTTITLLAQELQKKGIVKYSRGRVTILDREGLETCACECYRVIQREKLPLSIGASSWIK